MTDIELDEFIKTSIKIETLPSLEKSVGVRLANPSLKLHYRTDDMIGFYIYLECIGLKKKRIETFKVKSVLYDKAGKIVDSSERLVSDSTFHGFDVLELSLGYRTKTTSKFTKNIDKIRVFVNKW